MITAHPQVMPAEPKECAFFNRDLYAHPLSGLWYRSHFPSVLYKHRLSGLHNRKMLTGEVTPDYLYGQHAPGRVKATLPDAGLIVTLRNPVDRAYSQYNMEIRNRHESLTFEDAIAAEEDRMKYAESKAPDRNAHNGGFANHAYLAKGHYAEHLIRWFRYCDRDRLLILTLDELAADPQGVSDRVFDFLGLEPLDVKPPDRGPQDRDVKYGRISKSGSMHNIGIYPKMNPDTRRMLVDYFRPHNERLRALLKRDFDWDR